jgi:glutamate/tyrosine decarboxylase-like PLP-dependent enzyme
VRDLFSVEAPYVFADERPDQGRSIFEGSKPGAAAAAVWMAHRVLPLDASGYGRLIGETAKGARKLHQALERARFDPFQVVLLPRTDLNIVCFTFGHPALRSLEANNAFVDRIHRAMSAAGGKPPRQLDHFVSKTVLRAGEYGAAAEPLVRALGFTPEDYRRAGGLSVLRCTVMNPFLATSNGRADFLGGFLRTLHEVLRDRLA